MPVWCYGVPEGTANPSLKTSEIPPHCHGNGAGISPFGPCHCSPHSLRLSRTIRNREWAPFDAARHFQATITPYLSGRKSWAIELRLARLCFCARACSA